MTRFENVTEYAHNTRTEKHCVLKRQSNGVRISLIVQAPNKNYDVRLGMA